jgi:hypothetical protein
MGWKSKPWEKIPAKIAGKDILKRQLDNLDKDIPIRLVRLRQDGKEVLHCEKLVSN